jgi:hypothetical protein
VPAGALVGTSRAGSVGEHIAGAQLPAPAPLQPARRGWGASGADLVDVGRPGRALPESSPTR